MPRISIISSVKRLNPKALVWILVLFVIVMGSRWFINYQREEAIAERGRFALIIAQVGIAEALNRESQEDRREARDSVFAGSVLDSAQLEAYVASLSENEIELSNFWSDVERMTDSLVQLELNRARSPDSLNPEELLDSSGADLLRRLTIPQQTR